MAQHAIMAYSQLKMWILAVKDYSLASSLRSSLTPKIHSADPQILRKRHLFIAIGLETAMRRMEILSIQLKHIDLDRRIIYIPQAKAGARQQPITKVGEKFRPKYLKN